MDRTLNLTATLAVVLLVGGCGGKAAPSLPNSLPPWMEGLEFGRAPQGAPKPAVARVDVFPVPGLKDAEFVAVVKLMSQPNEDEVINALRDDPELVTCQHSQAGTLLLAAAGGGRTRVVKYLLDNGADPNISSLGGWSPLCVLVDCAGQRDLPRYGGGAQDHMGSLELLLAHKVDVERTRFRKVTYGPRGRQMETESLWEGGERLQSSRLKHSIERSHVLARLREHMNLPVDAMLPQNANSLYLQHHGTP